MKLLLDTHVAIWSVYRPSRLSPRAHALLMDETSELWVSAVTIWEIAVKFALGGRTQDPMPFAGHEAIGEFERAGYAMLSITPAHAAAVDGLQPLHKDPFDRFLVAQARAEPMALVTHDARLAAYGGQILAV